MNNAGNENPQKEVAYYRAQVNELSGAIIALEYKLAEMANEIKQMKKGFSLIAGLQQHKQITQPEDLYDHFTEQVNVQMQMNHSLMLLPAGEPDSFVPAHLKGYSARDTEELSSEIIRLPHKFVSEKRSLLVNSQSETSPLTELLVDKLRTRYFVLTPVIVRGELTAFLFAGRKVEVLPLAASRLLAHDLHALEGIAGVIAAIKNQFEQFRLLEEERTRIAREMHDDIGAELTKIKLFSHALLQPASGDHADHAKLRKIADAASGVLANVNEIIWTMNSQNDQLENLTAYVRRYASDYLESHELELETVFVEVPQNVFVNSLFRRSIVLIVKEALHNVVKHAKATAVVFTLSYAGGVLRISLKDDGKGIAGHHRSGNGLASMKLRAKAIGGELVIETGSMGTALELSVALADTSLSAEKNTTLV